MALAQLRALASARPALRGLGARWLMWLQEALNLCLSDSPLAYVARALSDHEAPPRLEHLDPEGHLLARPNDVVKLSPVNPR